MVTSFLCDEGSQFLDIHVDDVIRGSELLEDGQGRSAEAVGKHFLLCEARAFHEEMVHEALLLSCEVLDGAKPSSGEFLQGRVTVVVHVDGGGDPAKAEAISDNECVHPIVLREIGVGLFKFADLLGVEDMEIPLKLAGCPVTLQETHEVVAVDASRLDGDGDSGQVRFRQSGNDLFGNGLGTAKVVLYGKSFVFRTVWQHNVYRVVAAAYINANE